MQPSSIPTYRRAWTLYRKFADTVFHSASIQLPISRSNLGLFIAYMFQRNYAASNSNTYVSALGYSHRLAGVHDPTKVFWVIEMLKGYGKLGPRLDTRMPIILPILRSILQQTPTICGSDYRRCLFTAMCTTAFFGHQRAMSITLHQRSDVCPVQSLLVYLSRRGVSNGPLFCTEDGRAVSRQHFTEYLALIFRTCGLDPTKYKGHSFRIGAATLAAESGLSDVQIRSLEIRRFP